jgi:uncharacterized repeat protein (TIGR04138 family)
MSDPFDPFSHLMASDRRYKRDAYEFVWKALAYAHRELGMGSERVSEPASEDDTDEEARQPQRHVTGQELCEAIRQYALREYGFMAKTVLNSWGVYSTDDFGEIVFNLIRIGWMQKTPEDRLEDFHDQYDFDAAFQHEFRITLPE